MGCKKVHEEEIYEKAYDGVCESVLRGGLCACGVRVGVPWVGFHIRTLLSHPPEKVVIPSCSNQPTITKKREVKRDE